MLTKTHLRPLGGPVYQDQYWPLNAEQIETLELNIGRKLPDDYRDSVSTHGASAPIELWVIDGGPGVGLIGLDTFLGEAPTEHSSILHRSADYLEPLGLLLIIRAFTGNLYLAPDGSIVFERSGNPELHTLADSFEQLMSLAFIDNT